MKRRTLLGAALAAAAAGLGWAGMNGRDEDAIAMVIWSRLDYLRMDADGVRRFAADLARQHVVSSFRLHALLGLGPIYRRSDLLARTPIAELLRNGEERITSLYLLSSDFFANGMDVSKTVKYLGFFDPLCCTGNPFARRMT